MTTFIRGQRAKLADLTPSTQLRVVVLTAGSAREYDVTCFGLDAQGQLSDDRYMVFYNQPRSPEGAIELKQREPSSLFELHLNTLPATLERLMFTLTVEPPLDLSSLTHGHLTLLAEGRELLRFDFQATIAQEKALMLFELYRRGEWRVSALGQGFDGGLQTLLEHFGGEAAEESIPAAELPVESPGQWQALESGTGQSHTGTVCSRCGNAPGFLARLNPSTNRCKACTLEVARALQQFRESFLTFCSDGVLTHGEWTQLQAEVVRSRLDAREALDYVRGDAVNFLERTVSIAAADGEITEQEERDFYRLRDLLNVPPSMLLPLQQRMETLKQATQVRRGILPTIQGSIHLEAGELCHLETPATYRKITARSEKQIPGRLIATSKQIYFVSSEGGWNVKYKNVMRVEERPSGLNLELTVKAGNGLYEVADPLLVGATVDALVRLEKRLLLIPQTERASRHIPQDVRRAVWQRDGGKCVECPSSEYLEYDHIIPHSRGGASTLNNVQLLCRRCNLQKSNRI